MAQVARNAAYCVILATILVVSEARAGVEAPSLSESPSSSPNNIENNYDKHQEPRRVAELAKAPHEASNSIDPAPESSGALNFKQKLHKLKERLIHGHLQDDNHDDDDGMDPKLRPQVASKKKKKKTTTTTTPLSPVLLVPGYGGSRLEGKRDKAQRKHYFCEKHSDWSNIWVDLKLMLPYMIDCLIEDFRLEFDPQTNTTHNTQGVQIRVREPDNLLTVEYLTDIHLPSFAYFAPIIRKLTHAFNYKRNHNLRGAPYDFRKAPNELAEYFAWLRRECEQLREQFQQPVSFVCHSMGCNNVLYFLQQQPTEWKDKHIKRVVSLAAPWGGSMQAVRATAFGDNLGLPYLFDEAELKKVQQSVPSTMYLFPNERVFQDVPLIKTHTSSAKKSHQETIRANDFKRFFELIQHPDGYMMWLNTKDLLGQMDAPQVELWCLYGSGHVTLSRMEFKGEFPNSEEEHFHEDGDGTVTITSASFCKQWTSQQTQQIHLKAFSASHVNMIKDLEVLDMIEQIFGQ